MADLPPADPCATRRALDRLIPRPQANALNAAAEQIIDNVLTQIEAENRQDLARVKAREQLVRRINLFTDGPRQIGFTAISDSDPGGRLRITIDPEAWDGPIAGPCPSKTARAQYDRCIDRLSASTAATPSRRTQLRSAR